MSDTLGDDPRLQDRFRQIRERIDLSERHVGLDVVAEAAVRAFRDGVPPPMVASFSVGRAPIFSALDARLNAAAAQHRPVPTVLHVAEGDGLSHLMRWAHEKATSRGFAVARLDAVSFTAAPEAIQHLLVGTLRLSGRTLIEGLVSGQLAARPQAADHVRALASELGSSGIATLTYFLEAAGAGRLQEALAVIDWMLGAPTGTAWRRARGLPASPLLAGTARGVAAACAYLARAFGASGVLIAVDGRSRSVLPSAPTAALAGLPYTLVLSGASLGETRTKDVVVPSMSPGELRSLARLIRDCHVKAFGWPNAGRVANDELERDLATQPVGAPVRDWVRAVTARLDLLLAEQYGS